MDRTLEFDKPAVELKSVIIFQMLLTHFKGVEEHVANIRGELPVLHAFEYGSIQKLPIIPEHPDEHS